MSSLEFTEWQAYYRLEPFGIEREEAATLVQSALLANIHMNEEESKKGRRFAPSDFKPEFVIENGEDEELDLDDEEMQALADQRMLNLAGALGAKDTRKKE